MNWKKALSLVLILIIGLFVFIPHQAAADSSFINPYSNLFHSLEFNEGMLKNTDYGASDTPLYLRYPIWGYYFSNTISSDLSGLSLVNGLLSLCMVAMAGAALVVIGLLGWAFNFTGLDGIADTVNDFVKVLTDKLFFSEFFILGLFFLGISLMFAIGRNEDVAGKLIKVIFNLILAFTILFNMGTIIKYLNQLGWYGSSLVLKSYALVDDSGRKYSNDTGVDAFSKLGDKFFEYNVYIPFQLANFGGYAPLSHMDKWNQDQKQIDMDTRIHFRSSYGNVFARSLTSYFEKVKESSKEVVGSLQSIWNGAMDFLGLDALKTNIGTKFTGKPYLTMTPLGIPFRMMIVFLTFVIGTAYGCLLLAMAGASILCQIVMYLLAIFAPLIFLCALIPEWGDRVLLKWFEFLVAAAIYKIFSILVLVATLFTQGAIYSALTDWLYAMFAQILLVMAVFLFRKLLGELSPIAAIAFFQNGEDQLYNRSKQAVNKLIETTVDMGKLAIGGGLTLAGVATGKPELTKAMQMSGGTLARIAGSIAEDRANRRKGTGSTPPKPPDESGGNDEDPPDDNGGGGPNNRGPVKPSGGGNRQPVPDSENNNKKRQSTNGLPGGNSSGTERRTGIQHVDDGEGDGKESGLTGQISRRQAVGVDPTQTVAQGDQTTLRQQGISSQVQTGQLDGTPPQVSSQQPGSIAPSHLDDDGSRRTGVGNTNYPGTSVNPGNPVNTGTPVNTGNPVNAGSGQAGGTTIINNYNTTEQHTNNNTYVTQQSGSSGNSTGLPLTGGMSPVGGGDKVIERTVIQQPNSSGSSGIATGGGSPNIKQDGGGVVQHVHSGHVSVGDGSSSKQMISRNSMAQGGENTPNVINQIHVTNQVNKQGPSSDGTTPKWSNSVDEMTPEQVNRKFEEIVQSLRRDSTNESSFKGGVSGLTTDDSKSKDNKDDKPPS